jgi:hypothetical protein
MKSKVISIALLLLIFILGGCQHENQPTQNTSNESDLKNQVLTKKPHGDNGELITFIGDLAGSQQVVGCCPNAGPNPEYTMILNEDKFGEISGTHDGFLFMNAFGRKLPWAYMVQFSWTENNTKTYLEVRGGEVQKDKKNKITIITFTNEPCEIRIDGVLTGTVSVNFTVTREQL